MSSHIAVRTSSKGRRIAAPYERNARSTTSVLKRHSFTIRCNEADDVGVQYLIHDDQQFSDYIRQYAMSKGIIPGLVAFYYENKLVENTDTPKSLGFTGGERITALPKYHLVNPGILNPDYVMIQVQDLKTEPQPLRTRILRSERGGHILELWAMFVGEEAECFVLVHERRTIKATGLIQKHDIRDGDKLFIVRVKDRAVESNSNTSSFSLSKKVMLM